MGTAGNKAPQSQFKCLENHPNDKGFRGLRVSSAVRALDGLPEDPVHFPALTW